MIHRSAGISVPTNWAERIEGWRYVYLRRVAATALGAMGLHRSLRLAETLARGVFDLNLPGRRRAATRLRTAFSETMPDAQADAIIRTMYEHIARFWIEALFLPRMLTPGSWRRRVARADDQVLAETAAARHGCILATCYFGNPAVLAYALGQIFHPVNVIVDYLANPAARAWQEQLYRARNVRPIAVADALDTLVDALPRGQAIMLVVEHRRRRGIGAGASFLGESGAFHTTPGRLSAWFGVPVVPVLCRRRPGEFQFELWRGEPVRGVDPTAVTAAVLGQLDAQVRRYPEQYLWNLSDPAQSAADH